MYGGNKKKYCCLEDFITKHCKRCLKYIPATGLSKTKEEAGDLKLSFRIFFQFIGRNKPVKLHYFKSSQLYLPIPSKTFLVLFFGWG